MIMRSFDWVVDFRPFSMNVSMNIPLIGLSVNMYIVTSCTLTVTLVYYPLQTGDVTTVSLHGMCWLCAPFNK